MLPNTRNMGTGDASSHNQWNKLKPSLAVSLPAIFQDVAQHLAEDLISAFPAGLGIPLLVQEEPARIFLAGTKSSQGAHPDHTGTCRAKVRQGGTREMNLCHRGESSKETLAGLAAEKQPLAAGVELKYSIKPELRELHSAMDTWRKLPCRKLDENSRSDKNLINY